MNRNTCEKKEDYKAEIVTVVSVIIGVIMIITMSISNRIENAKVIELTESIGAESEVSQLSLEEFASKMRESEKRLSKHYELTEEERNLIEQVVSAESRGEPYDGQVAVAQCILNACLKDDIRPAEAIKNYRYTGDRVKPTDSVKEAVAAVFDRGEGVTEEPILFFYTPSLITSEWHESKIFVIEIANHRFFKEVQK